MSGSLSTLAEESAELGHGRPMPRHSGQGHELTPNRVILRPDFRSYSDWCRLMSECLDDSDDDGDDDCCDDADVVRDCDPDYCSGCPSPDGYYNDDPDFVIADVSVDCHFNRSAPELAADPEQLSRDDLDASYGFLRDITSEYSYDSSLGTPCSADPEDPPRTVLADSRFYGTDLASTDKAKQDFYVGDQFQSDVASCHQVEPQWSTDAGQVAAATVAARDQFLYQLEPASLRVAELSHLLEDLISPCPDSDMSGLGDGQTLAAQPDFFGDHSPRPVPYWAVDSGRGLAVMGTVDVKRRDADDDHDDDGDDRDDDVFGELLSPTDCSPLSLVMVIYRCCTPVDNGVRCDKVNTLS